MKRRISFLLAVLTVFLTLSSCADEVVLDYKVMLGDELEAGDNFYLVTEESYSELDILHVQYSNGIVLFTVRNYLTGEVGVYTYNIHTGEKSEKIKHNTASAMTYKSGFVNGGGVYTFDGASNLLTFYDDSMKEERKVNFVNISVGELFVSREYALTLSAGTLSRVTLANGAVEKIAEFGELNTSSIRFIGSNGDEAFISGYDDNFVDTLYSCNIKSAALSEVGNFDGKLLMRDGFAVNDNYNGNTYSVYEYDRPSVLSTLYLEESGEQLLGAGNGMICTSVLRGDDLLMTQTLRVYSIDKGALTSECDFEYDISLSGNNIREAFVVDDDFILVEIVENKTSRIALWKYSDSKSEPSTAKNLIAGSLEDEQKKANDAKIEQIREKWGVDVVVGDDAVRAYPDYVVVPENDQKALAAALDEIEETLEKYPEGFFAELIEKGAHDSLNIVLCKRLLPSHPSSLGTASGYYTELEKQYILISISGADIENTLSHEIMHAIESAMDLHSHTPFDKWEEYNPEGFEYANAYVDENGSEFEYDTLGGNTPYDPESMYDPDKIAFFDYYSKTFAKEDRARVFEMLMRSELSSYFSGKILFEKAKYLCESIDTFFDSVKDSDEVYWERILK